MTGIDTVGDDPVDHVGVAHPRDAALDPDVGRDALKRHDRDRARVLGDLRLLRSDDIHDHAALEHVGHAALDALGAGDTGGAPSGVPGVGVPSVAPWTDTGNSLIS